MLGEVIRRVPPLTVPDTESRDDLLESEAARLLLDRIANLQPDFTVTPEAGSAISTICRQLEGIPLALELAAARVPSLGVIGLAQHVDDRFGLLTTGNRAGPSRQRTLRATLDWSCSLLEEPERRVFERLSTFV